MTAYAYCKLKETLQGVGIVGCEVKPTHVVTRSSAPEVEFSP